MDAVPATVAVGELLENLLQLYIHDMSKLFSVKLDLQCDAHT
jgi:hypothetical protein